MSDPRAPASAQPARERRRPCSRLAFRLMITFGAALMPLALLSFVQMRQYQQEADARAERREAVADRGDVARELSEVRDFHRIASFHRGRENPHPWC